MGMILDVVVVMIVGMVIRCVKNIEGTERAVYMFGDSIFDVGTNHFLPNTTSRADMPFYGIDFPNSQITGRYSNGYNLADSIVQLMGLNQSGYPYLYLIQNDTEYFNAQILKGVNFASGGAGIVENVGEVRFKQVISLTQQIRQFESVRNEISKHLNDSTIAESSINRSLFLISVGNNDIYEFFWFNNSDFLNQTRRLQVYDFWMQTYQTHLQNLWKLGARKFGILKVGPLGCAPLMRIVNGSFQCETDLTVASLQFNAALESMVRKFASHFPSVKYSLANSYAISKYIMTLPAKYGYKNVKAACCGNLTLNVWPCGPDSKLCKNRDQYFFWDQWHPTQNASRVIAQAFFSGGTEFVTPLNFSQLLLLPS